MSDFIYSNPHNMGEEFAPHPAMGCAHADLSQGRGLGGQNKKISAHPRGCGEPVKESGWAGPSSNKWIPTFVGMGGSWDV